jgi:hypothetical protein
MANAVAEKKKNEVAPADALLSMFEATSSEGLENLTQDDFALPFLKILSGLDPILDDREDARKGTFTTPSRVRFTKVKMAYA